MKGAPKSQEARAEALRRAVDLNLSAAAAKGASGSGPKVPLRRDVATYNNHTRALTDSGVVIVCGWTGRRTEIEHFVSVNDCILYCPDCFDPRTGKRTNRRTGHAVGTRYPATRGWWLWRNHQTWLVSCLVFGRKKGRTTGTTDREEAERRAPAIVEALRAGR